VSGRSIARVDGAVLMTAREGRIVIVISTIFLLIAAVLTAISAPAVVAIVLFSFGLLGLLQGLYATFIKRDGS
jgi:hypothetical protein